MKARGIELPAEKNFWKLAIILSVNTFGVPYALVYWGQQHIPTGLSSILFASYPFYVAVFSHFRLPNEPINLMKGLGVIVGFLGIYVVFGSEIKLQGELGYLGMAAILLSSLLQAFALVTVKKYGKDFHPISLNFIAMVLGGCLLLSVSLMLENYTRLDFNSKTIASLLYLSIFGSVVAFVSYFWLLKKVQVVLLSLTAFVTPIIAVILGAVVLEESLTPQIFLGSSLVAAGILLANYEGIRNVIKQKKIILTE